MYIVQPQQLNHIWPQVQGWVSDAIQYGQGDENLDDVLIALARGQYMLWHEPEKFAAVVQIQHFPRQKVAAVLYLGGSDLTAIKKALVEEGYPWARAQGINSVRVFGRKGWERVLGMVPKGVILQVDLQQEGRLQ